MGWSHVYYKSWGFYRAFISNIRENFVYIEYFQEYYKDLNLVRSASDDICIFLFSNLFIFIALIYLFLELFIF